MKSEKLSKEQLKNAAEYVQCADSYTYFVENFCYIQDRKSEAPIRFKLWPGQKDIAPQLIKEKLLICLKARQLGITWLIVTYVVWRAIFHFNELIIVISGDNEEFSVEFMERVKFVFDRLPGWMKPACYKRNELNLCFGQETKDKFGNVKISGLNSQVKGLAPTSSAGQSKTVSLLILDEAALNRYCKSIYASAKPTLEHADGQMIVISNPNKDKPGWGWVRDIYTNSMAGINNFSRLFLPWSCVPGRGPNFLEEQKAQGMDDDDISIMYPSTEEEAISAMLGSYFGSALSRHKTEPGVRGYFERVGGRVRFKASETGIVEMWADAYHEQADWDQFEWEYRYTIGSDVSEGLGQTNSTAYCYDRVTDELICRMTANKIDAYEWAKVLILMADYYRNASNNAMLCVERTGPGQTTVKKIRDERRSQYVTVKPDAANGGFTKVYGWNETNNAKHELSGGLKTYLKDTDGRVRCSILIDECSTYIRHENGRLGHEGGKYDDHVIAAGLCIQAQAMFPAAARRTDVKRKQAELRKQEIIDKLGTGISAKAAMFLDRVREQNTQSEDEEWT